MFTNTTTFKDIPQGQIFTLTAGSDTRYSKRGDRNYARIDMTGGQIGSQIRVRSVKTPVFAAPPSLPLA